MARGIRRLSLSGSAMRENFDPARSDVDLLVEYEAGKHPGLDHFRIAEGLSDGEVGKTWTCCFDIVAMPSG